MQNGVTAVRLVAKYLGYIFHFFQEDASSRDFFQRNHQLSGNHSLSVVQLKFEVTRLLNQRFLGNKDRAKKEIWRVVLVLKDCELLYS